MTLFDLVNKCSCRIDAIELVTYDHDFNVWQTIARYTRPEFESRSGAPIRTKIVKKWFLSETFDYIHNEPFLAERVLKVEIWCE